MIKTTKNGLLIFATFIWAIATYMLLSRAYSWANLFNIPQLIISLLVGTSIGIFKIYVIFRKVAIQNWNRISNLKDSELNLWQFQSARSKLLIVFMMTFGIALRKSAIIPIKVLMPIYLGIGLAMLYVVVFNLKRIINALVG